VFIKGSTTPDRPDPGGWVPRMHLSDPMHVDRIAPVEARLVCAPNLACPRLVLASVLVSCVAATTTSLQVWCG